MGRQLRWFILFICLIGVVKNSFADPILPVEKAFIIHASQINPHHIQIHFHIAPGYYLYRDRIQAEYKGKTLPLRFPISQQETQDIVALYDKVTLSLSKESPLLSGEVIYLRWQGCARQEICYLPQTTPISVDSNGVLSTKRTDKTSSAIEAPLLPTKRALEQRFFTDGLLSTLVFLYLAGLGLAFTACMYPLIPIVSSLIIGKENTSYRRAFTLSFVYVQSMAVVYAGAGVLAALSGELVSITFQRPSVLIGLALFFILMASAAFGIFQLQMPHGLQSWLMHKTRHLPQGRYTSAVLLGIASSLLIGPCIAPPLAATLMYIGKEGHIASGALSLYVLALGIGTPLLGIGILGQRILPRIDPRIMGIVQSIFGWLLLGTAMWFIRPLLPGFWVMLLLSTLLFAAGGMLGWQIMQIDQHYIARAVFLGVAILLLVGGGVQLTGALTGNQDILRPLTSSPRNTRLSPLPFIDILSRQSLQQQLSKHKGKRVMLIFCAEWCVSCKEMEYFTFQDPKVRTQLRKWVLFKVDMTQNNAEQQALLKAFKLYGPPSIVFFNKAGDLATTRVIGYQKAQDFVQSLTIAEQEIA